MHFSKSLHAFYRRFIVRIKKTNHFHYIGGVLGVVSIAFISWTISTPKEFPTERVIFITDGMTLSEISTHLKDEAAIRSKVMFEALVAIFAGEENLKAGIYYFREPANSIVVAKRLATGQYGLASSRVTVPEGSTVTDVAKILKSRLPLFDAEGFLAQADELEGYLFPDTYFFLPTATPEQVIDEMTGNFKKKAGELSREIEKNGQTLADVVTMASILEKEAHTLEDKRMIAGILWKRIREGMPLQVDATFLYINGKNTFELTTDDLAIDSPYNTYRNKGLPPGPIANPGFDSILAAVTPEESPYFFYLSDRRGNLYYSEDFEQHKEYKFKYLN